MPARTIHQWLDSYSESHQSRANKGIHWLCVPGIFLTITALLWAIPVPAAFNQVPFLNCATLTLIPVILFYWRLSIKVALGMALFSLLCISIVAVYNQYAPFSLVSTAIVMFVVFWILQFIGHKLEGKSPSFFQDIQFLLIGPAWVISFIYRKIGVRL